MQIHNSFKNNLQSIPADSVPSLTALWGPQRNWSWPSTCWSRMIWCFTPSSCSACAPCRSPMFMGSTDRSTKTMAPTTSQRHPWEESMSTPSSWTRRGWRNQVINTSSLGILSQIKSNSPVSLLITRMHKDNLFWSDTAVALSLTYHSFITEVWLKGFVALDFSLSDYKRCTQAGIKAGANIYGVYVTLGFHGGSCDGLLNEMGGELPCFTRPPAECPLFLHRTLEPMLELWSQPVSPQTTQPMAAWWRISLPW